MTEPWNLSMHRYHYPNVFGRYLCGVPIPDPEPKPNPDPPEGLRCQVCQKKVSKGRVGK